MLVLGLNIVVSPFEKRQLAYLENCSLMVIAATANVGQLFAFYDSHSDAAVVSLLISFVFALNIVVLLLFFAYILLALRVKLRHLYENKPITFWWLAMCFSSIVSDTETNATSELEVIRDLTQEKAMWNSFAEAPLASERRFENAAKEYLSDFPESAQLRKALESCDYMKLVVSHKVEDDQLSSADLSALHEKEKGVFACLLDLHREKARIAATEAAREAQKKETEEAKQRMIAKVQQDCDDRAKYNAAFDNLREKKQRYRK